MTHPIKKQLTQFLNELKQLSNAESIPCIGGRSDLPTQPGLKVKGRHISLPVNQAELEWLCEQGHQSHFGKGMDTILDPDIRRSIEIEAQDIELLNPHWKLAIDQLLSSVTAQMGIDSQIKASLFKLLVYREGGHFKLHQDTEKAPGMFATLIVQLPSRCKGGSLLCRFSDKEYHFDFGNKAADSEFSVYYAAHYADVHHQVEKITEGSRLVLIYNLIQTETARTLSANYHKLLLNSARDMVAPIFSLLSQEQHAFLLQHEYTKQSLSDLSLGATKGQDRDLVTALLAINEHLPLENTLDFILARVSYSVSSSGNDYGYGGGYYRHNSEECMDWEEIESSDPSFDLCFDAKGNAIPADDLKIDWIHDLSSEEICSTAFDSVDEHFWGEGKDDIEGYMGNYGPTKETTYSKYLLVVMPAYPDNPGSLCHSPALQAHRVLSMAQDLRMHPDCDWLQKRFDQALTQTVAQFKLSVCQESASYRWRSGFKNTNKAIFITLLKTAIDINDYHLCQTLITTATECLRSSLSSAPYREDILNPLKNALDHFGWARLSPVYTPLLIGQSGITSLKISIALAENNTDNMMRSQLIDMCVSAVCNEKDHWGGKCGFKETILPLAIYLCKKDWSATDKSKALFLATCLEKSTKHPSFLSALIQQLINNTQLLDDIKWLLPALIRPRLHYLEGELGKPPAAFTWSMPNASASVQKKTIIAFLKSEKQNTDITGYDGIAMARMDVVNVETAWILPEFYVESNADFLQCDVNHGFSANIQAKGRGKNAYVEVKKDKRYHELCVELRQLREQECKKLQAMIEAIPKSQNKSTC